MNTVFMLFHLSCFLILISCGGDNGDGQTTSSECSSVSRLTDGDPLAGCAWHLNNIGQESFARQGGSDSTNQEYIDLNILNSGVRYNGKGIRIAISDTGLQLAHEDLTANILGSQNRNYSLSPPYLGDPGIEGDFGDHGTSVAGIIAAIGNNGKGSRGIASEASIAAFNFISSDQTLAETIDQANGDFDIFNQSWGVNPDESNLKIEADYLSQLRYGVTQLRAGKGALYVKASGNFFSDGVNSNMDPYNTTPYTIVTSAINASGYSASYSQAGSCNLIAAPGGEFGLEQPAIITTDLVGCQVGYARANATEESEFEKGNNYNQTCSYTSTFNGTSSATPMVSGAIALILQANPSLSWRDVRHILISTAKKVDQSLGDISDNIVTELPAVPSGYIWEQGWVTNIAGYSFHNWYGFGVIDVDAAVNMAQNYSVDLRVYNESVLPDGNWAYKRDSLSENIPDNNPNGVNSSIAVTDSMIVESVQIKVSITHPHSGDIALELTSPQGTKSILLNANNSFRGADNLDEMVLLSNAFYGEPSQGSWTLKVVDAAEDDQGTLTSWHLKINGGADSVLSF